MFHQSPSHQPEKGILESLRIRKSKRFLDSTLFEDVAISFNMKPLSNLSIDATGNLAVLGLYVIYHVFLIIPPLVSPFLSLSLSLPLSLSQNSCFILLACPFSQLLPRFSPPFYHPRSPLPPPPPLHRRKGLHILNLEEPHESGHMLLSSGKWEVTSLEWNPHHSQRNLIASSVCFYFALSLSLSLSLSLFFLNTSHAAYPRSFSY